MVAIDCSTATNMIRLNCAECNIEFAPKNIKQRFCSQSCAARQNNRLFKKRSKKAMNKCHCGSDCKALYCSTTCQREKEYRDNVSRWLSGEDNGTRLSTTATFIKRYLIESRGAKCEKCAWSTVHPKTGIVPVQMNHKDGNWQNNKVDNLELLCPSCHVLTDNYGGANKGNGRAWRGKYNQYALVAQ